MASAQPRLLIVDDFPGNRDILARRFGRHGFETVEADCGQKALELVEQQRFDLVLLDVVMPDLDGFEVLRRIRSRHSAVDLPVIMVTGKSDGQDIVKALELGANDYVTKPVDFSVALARAGTQIARAKAEQAIRLANEELQRANAELERRIAERTAELARAEGIAEREKVDREKFEARIQHLASHDELTGLGNRALLSDQLDLALKRARNTGEMLALVFLDVDRFKNINETMGYGAGDTLLKAMASRLRTSFGELETICRIGGDEFALIQGCIETRSRATEFLEQLLDCLGEPYRIEGQSISAGASVGVTLAPADGTDPEQLLRNADLALQHAKAEGSGRYSFFSAAINDRADIRRLLELDLRRPFGERRFEIEYQPFVTAATGAVSGFEALVRWRHPERGVVSPGEFIPIAEEIGLIVPLGEWILQEACAEATRWPGDLKVAVNLSPVQFRSPNLLKALTRALESSGLAAERLELEITETVLLEESDATLSTLHQMQELGARISIDDFGTGYASLAYLHKFPCNKIKIDQSFVQGLDRRSDCLPIIRSVVSLGKTLGLVTAAEGVETAQQYIELRRAGCTELQGHLFSKAMAKSKIPDWLEAFPRKITSLDDLIRGSARAAG